MHRPWLKTFVQYALFPKLTFSLETLTFQLMEIITVRLIPAAAVPTNPTIEDNQLESSRNHYLAAFECASHGVALAWLDLSTGEFQIAQGKDIDDLMPVLTAIDPAEMLIIEGEENRWRAQAHDGSVHDELIHFLATRYEPTRTNCREVHSESLQPCPERSRRG